MNDNASTDCDPELHSFEVRPETAHDHRSGRGHVLEVIHPASGRRVHTDSHNLTLAELADLHDRIGEYLEEHRPA